MNKSKKKRIRRRDSKRKEIGFTILGNNANSLLQKFEAFENLIISERPSIIFLQETKLGRPGRIKTPSSNKYIWFELHRTENAEKGIKGGGIAIGVLDFLEPSLISEGNDHVEAITVEIWLEGFPTRLLCAYGPQESDSKERKNQFWEYISIETQNARKDGAGLIIQMDGNLWAGKNIIPGDPNKQNQNGKLFENFLMQNSNLTVVNALPSCEGKITRERITNKRTEKSVLDFFIVCEKILPFISKMIIDERGENALTRYRGGKIIKADHHMLKLVLSLTIHEKRQDEQVEPFNLRNKLCLKQFKDFTTNTDKFTKCFSSNELFEVQFKRWQRQFQKALHANFRKIRHTKVDTKKVSKIDILMNKKKDILKNKNINSKDREEIEIIDKEISEECEEKEWGKLNSVLGSLDSQDSNINIWKQMRKRYPKKSETSSYRGKKY